MYSWPGRPAFRPSINPIIQLSINPLGLVRHLRHFHDDRRGEINQRVDDPRQEQEQNTDHRERLRHEGQRLFVDRRHRLKQADGEADDHGRQQNRRGDGQRLKDHGLQQFDGEFRIHIIKIGAALIC